MTRSRPQPSAADDAASDSVNLLQRFADIHELAVDLRGATREFQRLRAHGNFADGRDVDFRADDPNHALNRTVDITGDAEFLVAVTGAFSSGKSTLMNLLLERDGLLPASVIPMTAVCTVIRYADEPSCRVRYASRDECFARARATIGAEFKRPFIGPEHIAAAAADPASFVDGTSQQESLATFAQLLERYDEITTLPTPFSARGAFIAGGGVVADGAGAPRYYSPTPAEESAYREAGGDADRWVTREWLALIRDVELGVASPLLSQRAVFLDLPGLNCREDYHRRAIREFCNMADCIVVTAFQPGNQADADVVSNFRRLTTRYHDKIFFVFNKVDQFASEPRELVRAVDYLSKDTIGADFPRERFFLASAALGRASGGNGRDDGDGASEATRLGTQLAPIVHELPGLDRWVAPVTDPTDPGGIGHLRTRLRSFLETDAFPGKLAEVRDALRGSFKQLRSAASPTFEKYRDTDPTDLQRQAVLEAHRELRDRLVGQVQRFRFGYLQKDATGGGLRHDLHRILDRMHGDVQRTIATHFDRPILKSPLREDPVSEFDFLTIADTAANRLRQELQDHVVQAVDGHVRKVFREQALGGGIRRDLDGLLAGVPEQRRALDDLLTRFEDTLRHSILGIVRHGFFHMPRGRELRRLERRVPAVQLKDLLVSVFREFYPGWIYENIYTRLLDDLWLHLFLDGEDLERELGRFFAAAEGLVASQHAAAKARLPQSEAGADGVAQARNRWTDLQGTIELCRRIARIESDLDVVTLGRPLERVATPPARPPSNATGSATRTVHVEEVAS